MQVLFERPCTVAPKVSIILLDWSCRESFHTLDYLSTQTIPRDQYEVIWIEYYQRRSPEIAERLERCKKENACPEVDRWIVLEMSDDLYYHKHLMYNVGILASRGRIVVICDSDAVVTPTFVESILKTFDRDPNIVLHLDEVRNIDKKFHPFQYPSVEEILGEGCINWRNGKSTGVLDRADPIHTRNYGACMCALREDLVRIGGADEHRDYLGHVCGPYELTFRLMNDGKKEVWHEGEFLYHVWHPGTDGRGNYCGPHDGFNMSTTALKILRSGRREPLLENPAIKLLRSGNSANPDASLFLRAISESEIKRWKIDMSKQGFNEFIAALKRLRKKILDRIKNPRIGMSGAFRSVFYRGWIYMNLFAMSFKQAFLKGTVREENRVLPKTFGFKVRMVFVFLHRMWKNNVYVFRACRQVIDEMMREGVAEVALCGVNDATRIINILLRERRLKVSGIYSGTLTPNKISCFQSVLPLSEIAGYRGKVIVASFIGVKDKIRELVKLGIDKNDILRLL